MTNPPLHILSVVGARPNFMKIAPLHHALAREPGRFRHTLVHTGQHYDEAMSGDFFDALDIPRPDANLEVGSGSQAAQTANIMLRFEPICTQLRPDWVVVVGDVNSTLACALVAAKLGIRVAHVEAGLRSFDRTMPEEINRLLTDRLADVLFTPSPDADANLLAEGVPAERIVRVGNIMIDTLVANVPRAEARRAWERFSVDPGGYVFATLHRPANVDRPEALTPIVAALQRLAHRLPVVFPLHPRTRARLQSFDLLSRLEEEPNVRLSGPVGYHDCIGLAKEARLVLTDSGGLQEETTWLGVPCLTLRPNTERPVTITGGTNRLTTAARLVADAEAILQRPPGTAPGGVPALWDGKTADRIVAYFRTHG